jgi:phytoene desaturase
VTVLEKHSIPGGRARQLNADGFSFDMGPSWYWMPDIFERYFNQFGKKVSDYYQLKRLDPSYRIYWNEGYDDIPADRDQLNRLLEKWEPGSSKQLEIFLTEAAYKYRVGMNKLVFKPGLSIREFASFDLLKGMLKLDVFTSIKKHISKYFKDARIRQLLEFPVLFLGALPEHTPALYSLMNYADIEGGTWYPQGGMYSVVQAMHNLAQELGVRFQFNEEVTSFEISQNEITVVRTKNGIYNANVVVGSADYHFIEQKLLPAAYRSYQPSYWQSRELSPSCLLYFIGIDKKLTNISHHNLFFDASFEMHGQEIYKVNQWPSDPLFYVCAGSVNDTSVAPEGCENLYFLVPVASGLTGDDEILREKYFKMILNRFEKHTGENISEHIIFKKSFACTDFVNEYNSFKGNAYGLSNTLLQTAVLKPKCRSNKVKNLFYTGQLTVPGPGVPPSLISGEVVAGVIKDSQNKIS